MKNLLCLIILCIFQFCLHAQQAKEEVKNINIVGGTFSLFYDTNERSNFSGILNERDLEISFSPYLGLPLSNTSFFGINPQIAWRRSATVSSTQRNDPFASSFINFGINIFYRKNILSSKKISLFLQPNSGISTSRDLNTEGLFLSDDNLKVLVYTSGISIGGTLSLSPKWNLIFNIWDGEYTYERLIFLQKSDTQIERSILQKYHTIDLGFSFRNIIFGIERRF